ncbi:Flp pilus assembly complex ATPase component TadA [Candidatus Woesearchaeota archaeon]|nr:Flp pilus assembly complex ATPase component TadA [Candidatus Woesearchaeota archaeon]
MSKKEIFEKVVPDTSVIIEGILSRKIENGEIEVKEILVHEAVLAELENQANQSKETGFLGINELKRIRELQPRFNYRITFSGQKPRSSEIRYAKLGEIDSLIRDLAYDEDAVLFTADKVQAKVAEAKGMKVRFLQIFTKRTRIKLESYFDETTMSVHLRENTFPYAKKGRPGSWDFVPLSGSSLKREQIQEIASEIIEEASIRDDGFIEIERRGSTIVQLGVYRIVITRPAFSDGWEITAVRPVKKLSLDEYRLSEKLMQRIGQQAEGILIAGSPGAGKTTFVQALAEFYASQNKTVKTVEAPRDLQLPETITQYAISHGSPEEIHDILLLVRPDYTVFDEMRNTSDFKLFADMRLSGVGMIGVLHATNPIDAIQRFVGRIELGVIPQVIDTVIFIKDGEPKKVFNLAMVVKVPSGMTEQDLARPVVVVNDFESNRLEYELYSYGEETVVIPVKGGGQKSTVKRMAEKSITQYFKNISGACEVDVTSENSCTVRVPEKDIPKIIGRQGKNIEQIEKDLGLSINVEALSGRAQQGSSEGVAFDPQVSKNSVLFYVDERFIGKNVEIYLDDDYLLTANVGKKARIKIHAKNKIGKMLEEAIHKNGNIRLILV